VGVQRVVRHAYPNKYALRTVLKPLRIFLLLKNVRNTAIASASVMISEGSAFTNSFGCIPHLTVTASPATPVLFISTKCMLLSSLTSLPSIMRRFGSPTHQRQLSSVVSDRQQ